MTDLDAKFPHLTILLVDDEEDILEILRFHFMKLGMNVLTALNGREAFKLTETHEVDLILSDVSMPEMNGEELLKMVRQRSPTHPAFFFISGNIAYSPLEAKLRGAQGAFQKPFLTSDIERIMRAMLTPQLNA